jgi:C4-dicarboxylate-specific signal transduction histidine kinase
LKKLFAKGITEQEKYLKQIDDIDKTIVRISKIVNGLKNVSRDANNETFSNCLIYDSINDALSVCSEKFKIGGIKVIINLDDPIFQTSIFCLQVQLSQVFFNILGNSFDAVEKDANPWVKISAISLDNMLIIRCEDSGLGIPKEIHSKIFQPFYTTKVVGKGTGLGLSLCNTIIKNHGGEFLIDNDSKNTCFIIKLPKNGKINE